MGSSKMDSSAVYALFEELKQKIDEQGSYATPNGQTNSTVNSDEIISLIEELKVQINQSQFSEGQIKNLGQISAYSIGKVNESLSKVQTELKATIKPIDEKINQIKSQQDVVIRKEHVFSIDFQNSKAALTMISMALVILLSFGCNIWQLDRDNQLKDNDLKYRYIKSTNGINQANLNMLEDVFYYQRDKNKIGEIRQKVEEYERDVQKAAEEIERKQLKVQNKH
jgi:hypothetical protein